MSTTTNTVTLASLQQKIHDSSRKNFSLEQEDLNVLITGFRPRTAAQHRSEAYLLLSAFCQAIRRQTVVSSKDQADAATQALTNTFAPPTVSRLNDVEENSVVEGISFLTALFQVDHEVASSVFLRDGVVDCIADSVDLFTSAQFSLEIAHLLSQACGHKPCRDVLPTQALQWLTTKSRQTTDSALRAAASIALIKLARNRTSDGVEDRADSSSDQELAGLMRGIVIEGNQSSLADAIEGLAYLSVDPILREELSRDPAFLSRLFSLVPQRNRAHSRVSALTNPAILYGVVVIISNICMYRPRMNEEAAQIEKLKRFVQAGKKPGQGTQDPVHSSLEDDQHCRERTRRLVASGVVDILTRAVYTTDSDGVRSIIGRAILSVVEDKDNRGKVLQCGGAKALTMIIQHSLPPPDPATPTKTSNLGADTLSAIQALAKLAITSSPIQVFGPNEGAMYDSVRPLTLLLLHPSSNLLQRFESMMALTNLSSQSPELASRIAKAENLMDRVELFLLEDHVLIRRAAMELICNLVAGSDEVFEKYSGPTRASESKLQIVVAMSDVDDLPTKLAASGTLATLTAAPTACQILLELQQTRGRVLLILTRLIDPSSLSPTDGSESDDDESTNESGSGLMHRGVICAHNFLLNIRDAEGKKQIAADANRIGLTKALTKVVQDPTVSDSISKPAISTLKWLAQ